MFYDEADFHFLDRQRSVPTCLGVVGLSATTVNIAGLGEEKHLRWLGFKLLDSKIEPNFDPSIPI